MKKLKMKPVSGSRVAENNMSSPQVSYLLSFLFFFPIVGVPVYILARSLTSQISSLSYMMSGFVVCLIVIVGSFILAARHQKRSWKLFVTEIFILVAFVIIFQNGAQAPRDGPRDSRALWLTFILVGVTDITSFIMNRFFVKGTPRGSR